jgi:hypothetical protein
MTKIFRQTAKEIADLKGMFGVHIMVSAERGDAADAIVQTRNGQRGPDDGMQVGKFILTRVLSLADELVGRIIKEAEGVLKALAKRVSSHYSPK